LVDEVIRKSLREGKTHMRELNKMPL